MTRFRPILFFLAGVVLTAGALGAVLAASGGDSEVRLSARRIDDGRVEIALQQTRDDGTWGERSLPEQRFLPADAEAGVWHSSNPLVVAAAQPEDIFFSELPNYDDAVLICAITHQREGDEAFWSSANRALLLWDNEHPQARVELRRGPTAADQSRHIRECVAEGAGAIAITLPDPDGVREALAEAGEAGVMVTSFNSGRESYVEVGSVRHASIDETAAGRVLGAEFNERGVSGLALCVSHEPANIALAERCDGFEATYDGDVERFSVADSGTADLAATADVIAERLRSGSEPVGAVVTLNAVVSLAARDAVAAAGSEAAIATFDSTPEVLQAIVAGEILLAINTRPYSQAYNIMAVTFHTWIAWNTFQERFGVNPTHIVGTSTMTIDTRLYTAENAGSYARLGQSFGESSGSSSGGGGRPGS